MGKIDDPFGMKFILPEHTQALAHHYYKESLITQPTLEDDELAEINRIIHESVHQDYAITVTWFTPEVENRGSMLKEWGVVKRIDPIHKQIKLVNDEDFWWIDMHRIVKVDQEYPYT
ncbi:YolD-like family protein [Brevibacillus choshinensis]|uniref:YolD-like family protein n=1 Tax=Brevibacillus choshinensis TaxID=54911 RepID=UPI002E1B7834|nr:YolD-like family protein [Brevibacillus choshinensis]